MATRQQVLEQLQKRQDVDLNGFPVGPVESTEVDYTAAPPATPGQPIQQPIQKHTNQTTPSGKFGQTDRGDKNVLNPDPRSSPEDYTLDNNGADTGVDQTRERLRQAFTRPR